MLILGLDGLDYTLVNEWRMNWFKQKYYGKHYIGFLETWFTPIIWGTFLTGKNVEKEGFGRVDIKKITDKQVYRNIFLNTLFKIRLKIPVKSLGIRLLLNKLGFILDYPKAANMPDRLKKKTFLEELKEEKYKIFSIEIPSYNENKNPIYRAKVWEVYKKPFIERKKFVEGLLFETEIRVKKAMKYVNDLFDIVFVYSNLPDGALHLVYKPKINEKIWLRKVHYELYKKIENLIKKAYELNYVVLIISDHGFDLKNYKHSEYGFWSLNVQIPSWWKINTVLDFKEKIIKMINEKIKL